MLRLKGVRPTFCGEGINKGSRLCYHDNNGESKMV